jgi:hypothetical protein
MLRIKEIILAIVALLYALSLCSLAVPFAARNNTFVSPDEHAVWVFAQQVATTGAAQVEEIRNTLVGGILHPRSAVTVGAMIVPSGFLGMPYVAGAFYFFSPLLAACTGPILGMLGLFALYGIVRKSGGSREFAVLTTIALAIHPAWWYYSMRSLMPNVPFVSLLLCAIWLVLAARETIHASRRVMMCGVSGVLLGVAMGIRTSEWLWIVGALIATALFVPSLRTYKKEIASAGVGFVMMIGVWLGLQHGIYGAAFTTGYTVDIPAWEVGGAITTTNVSWYQKLFALLFPFGIHERATLQNAWNYLVVVYPWMTVMGVLGAGCWSARVILGRRDNGALRLRAVSSPLYALSSVYLLILYGSWTFFDNPDPTIVSLGNSHVRYWLPFAVLAAPCIAFALLAGKRLLLTWSQSERSRMLASIFPAVALTLLATLSARAVFTGDDGVIANRRAMETFVYKREQIIATTPDDAIVIVDRADKYLWPDRAVIVPLRSDETYAAIPKLLDISPLYYFGITLPHEDLTYLREVKFAGTGISFVPVITIQEETLYVITRE